MKQTLSPLDRRDTPHVLSDVRREFERLIDDIGFPGLRLGGALAPETDYAETETAIVVTAELPGVDAKDVEISLQDNMLSIRGEKKAERNESNEHYRVSERSYGSFERVLRVPAGIDADQVTAEFDKGVLKVTLPKSSDEQAKRHKIAIESPAH